ncbi:MAG: hypothetical protein C4524_01805 [Candidatus Zixiibacteriota bacterium]|nr:MAG: hypothetical protein C4524_01805 [candidate division Zixibacteria bacterium]
MNVRLALVLPFVLAVLAGAQDLPLNLTTVTARGQATVYAGDLAAAREEALVDAQRNALEQVLGAQIRSQTAVQDFQLADDTILSLISGHVRNTKILSETQDGETLTLEAQVDVAAQLSEEEAQALMRNFSCVVGLSMTIDGGPMGDDRLVQALSADLVKAGFDVRDIAQLAALEGYDGYRRDLIEQQDAEAARWAGRQLLSNVVIAGRADLKQAQKKQVTGFAGTVGVYAYECWIQARALEAESGQVIAQYAAPLEGIRGVGDTPQAAVTEALKSASTALSRDLLTQLTAYSGKKSRPITIEIEGLPSLEEYQAVKQRLNNVRFRDSEVQDLGFQQGRTSTFRFDYSEKIALVALKLDRMPGLEVTDRTATKVVCRYVAPEATE